MGDIMLKKAREYLQDRLDDVNRELKERKLLQKDYPELRRKYQEGRYFADLVMDLDKARRTVVERLLFYITVISLGGACAVLIIRIGFLASFLLGLAVSALGCSPYLARSINKYKKIKEKLNKTEVSFPSFNREHMKDVGLFGSVLYSQTEYVMEMNELMVKRLTREAKALWDILSSDDFVEALIRQNNNTDEVARALYSEWQAYLSEISLESPTEFNPSVSEVSLENESITDVKGIQGIKKLEKKSEHPLSTF